MVGESPHEERIREQFEERLRKIEMAQTMYTSNQAQLAESTRERHDQFQRVIQDHHSILYGDGHDREGLSAQLKQLRRDEDERRRKVERWLQIGGTVVTLLGLERIVTLLTYLVKGGAP